MTPLEAHLQPPMHKRKPVISIWLWVVAPLVVILSIVAHGGSCAPGWLFDRMNELRNEVAAVYAADPDLAVKARTISNLRMGSTTVGNQAKIGGNEDGLFLRNGTWVSHPPHRFVPREKRQVYPGKDGWVDFAFEGVVQAVEVEASSCRRLRGPWPQHPQLQPQTVS